MSQVNRSIYWLALLTIAVHLQGAELHIVVINSKTGKPQPKELVRIAVDGIKASPVSCATDISGVATFNVPADGKKLLVDFQHLCATDPALFPLDVVLSKGLVVKDYCWHKFEGLEKIRAKPGEIIVFYDKLNFFEQLEHINDAPGVP
jgi:hypothetical protein